MSIEHLDWVCSIQTNIAFTPRPLHLKNLDCTLCAAAKGGQRKSIPTLRVAPMFCLHQPVAGAIGMAAVQPNQRTEISNPVLTSEAKPPLRAYSCSEGRPVMSKSGTKSGKNAWNHGSVYFGISEVHDRTEILGRCLVTRSYWTSSMRSIRSPAVDQLFSCCLSCHIQYQWQSEYIILAIGTGAVLSNSTLQYCFDWFACDNPSLSHVDPLVAASDP